MNITCPHCATEYVEEDGVDLRFCGRCGSDMRQRGSVSDGDLDPLVGQTIDARYRVIGKIGAGGMGAVYRVEHLGMGKQAAMKVLHPALTHDAEVAARFKREAEAVSRLSHPNSVQVFDFGRARGFLYLVMELVRGEDLGGILRRDGPMEWSRVRRIVMQVCDALAEAHEAGIVHRDLKPENLLLMRHKDGRDFVKVVDFGLAKLRDREEMNQVTARGSLVGTPFYMSPEQIRAEEADARSDIYSLGALMYRMVTGEHPFAARTPVAVLTQHLTEVLVPPSKRRPDLAITAEVDAIIGKCMAKEAAGRFQSAEELRRVLEESPHVSLRDVPAPPAASDDADDGAPKRRATDKGEPTGAHSPRALRREDIDTYESGLRWRRWVGALVVPLIIVGGGGGFAYWRYHQKPAPLEVEVEPNNNAKEANLIGRNKTVRGHIGKCLTPQESDRDFYRFTVERAPAVLKASLTGLPAMNLKLSLFAPSGQKLADADDGDPGEGEVLPNVRLEAPGEYYLAVREVWVEGRPATEDDVNWYTLSAAWKQVDANEETEPNDSVAQATPLVVGLPMRGFAGRRHDVDFYVLRGADGQALPASGTLTATLSSIDGVDLRLIALPPGASLPEPAANGALALPPGAKVADAGGAGFAEELDGVALSGGEPIIVVERKDSAPGQKENAKGARRQLVGLDVPYALTLRLKP